jgi:transcriptional regulator with XRE-family HTH domain
MNAKSKSLIERIKIYMRKNKKSHEDLARGLGVNRTTVTHILTGRTKITLERIIDIANILQIDTKLLTDGIIDFPTNIVKLANDNVRNVPYIPLNQSHMWEIKMEDAKTNPGHPMIPVNTAKFSDHCFYSKVDSNLLSPIFSLNDDIIIDPLRVPQNGNYIIVHLLKENINVIRQYFVEGSRVYLKAAENMPLHQYATSDLKIIAVIVARQINMI